MVSARPWLLLLPLSLLLSMLVAGSTPTSTSPGISSAQTRPALHLRARRSTPVVSPVSTTVNTETGVGHVGGNQLWASASTSLTWEHGRSAQITALTALCTSTLAAPSVVSTDTAWKNQAIRTSQAFSPAGSAIRSSSLGEPTLKLGVSPVSRVGTALVQC